MSVKNQLLGTCQTFYETQMEHRACEREQEEKKRFLCWHNVVINH